uniref:NADH dehydrogenase subunit 6 n=1 Tax=Anagyrus galinae TaxID=3085291 RepID=UPI002A817E4F|nr:NADH dehydrogenase subunit 6 [Anagyrus galinae]WON65607.1 NADH dehydrogenase subunit 6 [Anagyrus galinae]
MMKFFMTLSFFFLNLSLINLILMNMPNLFKLFHPMIMGIILLFYSIFSSINISIFLNNSWFSYIMFLVMIGGLMILFLYFTSFIDNMISSIKMNMIKLMNLKFLFLMIMMTYIIMMKNKFLILNNKFNEILNLLELMKFNILNQSNNIPMSYMLNKNIIILISIIYILIILTLIVKILMINKFTLRKTN